MVRKKLLLFCLVITIAACTPQSQFVPGVVPTLTPFQPIQNPPTLIPVPTSTPASPTTTIQPLAPVPEAYLPYTIDYLRNRAYGGGQIEILQVMEEKENFTRYLIRYPSDGLNIYGFVNVPKRDGPLPIIIMIHGYEDANTSTVLGYTIDTADFFADNGYLVLHPNMRGYPPSDNGDNLYRVGLAVDVLNLIALVKDGASQPGWLQSADPARIGLWGHSLGGGVALRVATVSEDIKAVLLYAAISGDESKNAALFYQITGTSTNLTELGTPPEIMAYISPANYFDKITASVKLYHGSADEVVPVAWAMETCDALKANAIDVDCTYYIDGKHTFFSKFQPEFNNSMLAFFAAHLIESQTLN